MGEGVIHHGDTSGTDVLMIFLHKASEMQFKKRWWKIKCNQPNGCVEVEIKNFHPLLDTMLR
jgi:hypothetical protein